MLNSDENVLDAIVKSYANDPKRSSYLYISSTEGNLKRFPEISNNFIILEKRLEPFFSKNRKFKADIISRNAYAIAESSIISAFKIIFPYKLWDPNFRSWINEESDVLNNLDTYFNELSAIYGFNGYCP